MEPKGTKYERETVIRWNEEENVAHIWTASGSTYRRLVKRGFVPVREDAHSAWFQVPKSQVKLPRPKSEKRAEQSRLRMPFKSHQTAV